MFTRSARFYDALYSWKDYAEETSRLVTLIRERNPQARTLLDVACGTGKHLELLQEHFEVEGLDLDTDMLTIARQRLPDVPLHHGDMLEFDLSRRFDVLTCLFSSIAYSGTTERLGQAIQTMAAHVAPGGVLVVEPFFTPEQWTPGHPWALFVDEPDLKIARMDVAGPPKGRIAALEFHYLVATPHGIESFTELHEITLFTHEEHVEAFRFASLDPEHDPEGLMGRGLYVAVKPA
jgi:ubiquinone/menaquinone biosynthesis C-methylase UbiE